MCPFPSPDAGRGLGGSRSPQGNICTFQTHVVSGGGECQAPARHPHPCAGRRTGNRAWGERTVEGPRPRLCNPLLPSQQLPPPSSGRTGQPRWRDRKYPAPLPRPRAPFSSLHHQESRPWLAGPLPEVLPGSPEPSREDPPGHVPSGARPGPKGSGYSAVLALPPTPGTQGWRRCVWGGGWGMEGARPPGAPGQLEECNNLILFSFRLFMVSKAGFQGRK